MEGGGAYGAGKAGGPFDPIAFVKKPQVILRAVSWVSGLAMQREVLGSSVAKEVQKNLCTMWPVKSLDFWSCRKCCVAHCFFLERNWIRRHLSVKLCTTEKSDGVDLFGGHTLVVCEDME